MSTIQDLKPFNDACDEFVSGKYLLVDIKLASILKLIADSEKLVNIVNSCLQDYDFSLEYNKYIRMTDDKPYLSIPSTDKEIIAFVYNLLYKFKSGSLDFYQFLSKFYGIENTNKKEFAEFAENIIIPFKNAINNIYSKRHVLVETDDYQNNIYNKIMSTIKLIIKNLDAYKLNMNQKEEFTMLLNSLYLASEKNDKKLVFSLMIGLDYFTKCNKKSRIAYLSLEECFEK